MSTGFRGGFIRGIDTLLRQDDGVDAGVVSDHVVNNLGHLYDAHHSHIVNIVTADGLSLALRQDEPNAVIPTLVGRWAYPLIVAEDGGSAKVVYRFNGYRSGGSGNVIYYARIGTASIRPLVDGTVPWLSSHTISGTTPTAASGTLYVPASSLDTRHPPQVISGAYGGSGTRGEGAHVRLAWFELWCLITGAKPSVRVSSLHARQFLRAP